MSGAPEDIGFDRGYCCAVANIVRTHGDTVIARDVLRANEPGDWNDIDASDRDIIEQSGIKSNNYVTVKTEDVLLKIKEWKDNAQDSAPNPEKAD